MKDLNFFSIYQGSIKERKDTNMYVVYILTAIVAVFILFTTAFNTIKFLVLRSEINEYTTKLNSNDVQSKLAEAETINDKLSILNKYEGSLSNVVTAVKGLDLIDDKLLIDISGAIPSDMSFKEWKMDNYQLSIKGLSNSRTAIAEFEHNLSKLPEFKLVHVDKIKTGTKVNDPYEFEMTCILKEVE